MGPHNATPNGTLCDTNNDWCNFSSFLWAVSRRRSWLLIELGSKQFYIAPAANRADIEKEGIRFVYVKSANEVFLVIMN